ncbi:DUF4157 domain-containing protein [Lentzea sp. BCCO 10_0061]|uniref:DUF4157 domain-containing protein n=1 Tax=Lentzea sokolovensis TaxID=3095429 RepID=A0ABU4V840_9PSEU|nr:DUF4157 domain-containing protein [Lentzea sp. BCCO 10_0061]MDX8147379.1 DUF4157 domain-containing protein [Lentzea sp. BCCO 10_0061]
MSSEREPFPQNESGAVPERAGLEHALHERALRSPGKPLDPAARALMQERFRADFAHVRVHTDAVAAESATAAGAKAYTVGDHIVFNEGEYAPGDERGKRSLAHELAHVVQQSRGGAPAPGLTAGHHLEHDAHQAADHAAGGGPVVVAGASSPGIARQAGEMSWLERKAREAYHRAAPAIEKAREFVSKVNEAPSLNEVVAQKLEQYAAKTAPDGPQGAALKTTARVMTAAAKVTSQPRRAAMRATLQGHPIQAVQDYQKGVDEGLAELKKEVFNGIEAYEDGKFGTSGDPLTKAADSMTGGKASAYSRQVQGGLMKSVYTMGEGLANIVVHPVRTAEGLNKIAEMASPTPSRDTMTNAAGLVSDLADPKTTAKQAGQNYLAAEEAKQKQRQAEMLALVKGLGENYIEAWKKKRYGEIPGLLLGDVGSFFIGAGEGKAAGSLGRGAGAAGKIGEAAKVADLAKAGDLGKAGELGKVGDAAKAGDLAKVAETAKPLEAAEGLKATGQPKPPALPKEAPAPTPHPSEQGPPGYRRPAPPPEPSFPPPEPRKPFVPEPKPMPPEPKPLPPEPKPVVHPLRRRRQDPPPFKDSAPVQNPAAARAEGELAEVVEAEEASARTAAEADHVPAAVEAGGDRAVATAGPKKPVGQPVHASGTTTQAGPARGSGGAGGGSRGGGGGGSGGGGSRRPRRPSEPKEPPIPAEGIGRTPSAETLDRFMTHFQNNRRRYPADIRKLIDEAALNPTRTTVEAVDTAIRDLYASRVNKALGYSGVRRPHQLTAPFRTSVKGHSPLASEGGRFEAMMEVGPNQRTPSLNLQGQTKNGILVDVDHFDFAKRSGREIKMPLAIKAHRGRVPEGLFDQLVHQAEWTRDWGMRPFQWELHSLEDLRAVQQAVRENLHRAPVELADILHYDVLVAPGRGTAIRITYLP